MSLWGITAIAALSFASASAGCKNWAETGMWRFCVPEGWRQIEGGPPIALCTKPQGDCVSPVGAIVDSDAGLIVEMPGPTETKHQLFDDWAAGFLRGRTAISRQESQQRTKDGVDMIMMQIRVIEPYGETLTVLRDYVFISRRDGRGRLALSLEFARGNRHGRRYRSDFAKLLASIEAVAR
jgi:hypothetical protein